MLKQLHSSDKGRNFNVSFVTQRPYTCPYLRLIQIFGLQELGFKTITL